MDNITHSLAGSLTAELALRAVPERARAAARTPLHATALIANNLPDLDFVYTFITPGKIGYLLHHRGHTHTLPLALLLALLSGWLIQRIVMRRAPDSPPILRPLIVGLSAFGGLLHIAMDWGNNYGVHPFWPLSGRWFYGDTLFIVEPLLIVAISATLVYRLRSRVMRAINALLCGLFVVLPWFFPLPWLPRLMVALCAATFLAIGRWRAERQLPSVVTWVLLVYTLGVTGSRRADAIVREAMRRELPDYELLDVVRTPAPATPYCWEVIAVAVDDKDYLLRTGKVAVVPWLAEPEDCPTQRSQPKTAPMIDIEAGAHRQLRWSSEWRGSRQRFEQLANQCWSAAFLRFARVPYWLDEQRVVGDLRYDRSEDLDFAEMQLPETESCPPFVPPWDLVRADVLPP